MSMDWCHHCSTLIDTDTELEFYGVENKCANCRDGERNVSQRDFEAFIADQEAQREEET